MTPIHDAAIARRAIDKDGPLVAEDSFFGSFFLLSWE